MRLRRFRCAIGGGAGRGGERVLRGNEHDAAPEPLILHDAVAFARRQEIAGRENCDVAVPELERGVLERRGRGDAGVGDDDVDPAVGEDRLAEGGLDRILVGHVGPGVDDRVPAEPGAEFGNRRLEARLVDVGEHDACAFAHEARGDRPPDSARSAGDERDAADERFRLRHPLELGLFQEPVFDVERLLLVEADIAADAGGAAHDVDRVDIEFRRDPRGRLVSGEGEHADAGDEVNDGVGIAHRRRVRPLAALVIGRIVGAIGRKAVVERGDDRVEIVRRRIERQHQRPDLRAQEMIGAGRAERRKRFELARVDEFEHSRRVGEMADLALAGRDALADRRHEPRGDAAPLFGRKGLHALAAEGLSARVCSEPGGGLVDHGERRLVAGLRGRAPGEEPVAAEHGALEVRACLGHRAELEAEVEARPLPGQEAEFAAKHFFRQLLGVFARRDRDHRVGVDMVDMGVRHEAVQRRVDRGRARIEIEGAVVEERHHLVLVREATIDRLQAQELVEIEGREAVELHRAEVAARALDPQHLDRRAGQRIGAHELGRGVAAAEIGDAQIAADEVRAIEQQSRFVELGGDGVVPQIGQWRVGARKLAAHGSFLSIVERF